MAERGLSFHSRALPGPKRPTAAAAGMGSKAQTALRPRTVAHDDLREEALLLRLPLDGRLVGLDLGEHVARRDRGALLLAPRRDVALRTNGARVQGVASVLFARRAGAIGLRARRVRGWRRAAAAD